MWAAIMSRQTIFGREGYYSSVRAENEGLRALYSVRQGRCVDLLLDRLGFSVTCTLVTLELLTGIHGKGYTDHFWDAIRV